MQATINKMEDLRFGKTSNVSLSYYRWNNFPILLIKLRGQIDASNATEIRNRLTDEIVDEPPLVLFDMQAVTMMDSTGIGALALAFNLAKFFGGKIAVCALQHQPSMLFEITNMHKILYIYDTREEFEAAIPQLLELP
ncbi:anti-sigma-factor antagonist (plasmid) [Thalassoporum mexicanum PCC 7367]|uniref:STAS domain-containing protein n=1 Tax=Thalassoporum mexicanum TaxID=3457544 RepID=UPI00029FCC6E|nr:STAS domain-containing protein [Pseudanabaena sp. PCC 7367]AFY72151.1 anti-sigma-factor antagonist [Pseudanabaena sp. PCC 7367]